MKRPTGRCGGLSGSAQLLPRLELPGHDENVGGTKRFSARVVASLQKWALRGTESHTWTLANARQKKGNILLIPLHSAVAERATLSALQRGSDPEAAQALPAAAEDRLDAVVPGAEPAGHLQLGQGEVTLRQ